MMRRKIEDLEKQLKTNQEMLIQNEQEMDSRFVKYN